MDDAVRGQLARGQDNVAPSRRVDPGLGGRGVDESPYGAELKAVKGEALDYTARLPKACGKGQLPMLTPTAADRLLLVTVEERV